MVTSSISHDEATIQSYMRRPDLAKSSLNSTIEEGDLEWIRVIWRRIQEVMLRLKAQNEAKSA